MAMMVSAEARRLFLFLTGDEFPDVDEDLLRALADAWENAGRRSRDELGPELRRVVAAIRSKFSGEAARAFVAVTAPFTDGPDNYIDRSAVFFFDMAALLRGLALDVEYMKYVVVLELDLLAVEMSWAAALGTVFGPWVIPWLGSRIEMAREAVEKMLVWLDSRYFPLGTLARFAAPFLLGTTVSMVNQVGVTWAAQQIQFGKGTRHEWTDEYFRDAAVVAAFGGATAPFAGVLGHRFGRFLLDLLDRRGQGDWHRAVAFGIAHVVEESLHEGVTATLANAALTHQFEVNRYDFTSGASSGVARRVNGAIAGRLTKLDAATKTEMEGLTGRGYHLAGRDDLSGDGKDFADGDASDFGAPSDYGDGVVLRGGGFDGSSSDTGSVFTLDDSVFTLDEDERTGSGNSGDTDRPREEASRLPDVGRRGEPTRHHSFGGHGVVRRADPHGSAPLMSGAMPVGSGNRPPGSTQEGHSNAPVSGTGALVGGSDDSTHRTSGTADVSRPADVAEGSQGASSGGSPNLRGATGIGHGDEGNVMTTGAATSTAERGTSALGADSWVSRTDSVRGDSTSTAVSGPDGGRMEWQADPTEGHSPQESTVDLAPHDEASGVAPQLFRERGQDQVAVGPAAASDTTASLPSDRPIKGLVAPHSSAPPDRTPAGSTRGLVRPRRQPGPDREGAAQGEPVVSLVPATDDVPQSSERVESAFSRSAAETGDGEAVTARSDVVAEGLPEGRGPRRLWLRGGADVPPGIKEESEEESSAESEDHNDHDESMSEGCSDSSDEPMAGRAEGVRGLTDAVARHLRWHGYAIQPEDVVIDETDGPVKQTLSHYPVLVGGGHPGLVRVTNALPRGRASALMAVNIDEPGAEMVNLFRTEGGDDYLITGGSIPLIHRLDPDNVRVLAAHPGRMAAALFDADRKPVRLIPPSLDGDVEMIGSVSERRAAWPGGDEVPTDPAVPPARPASNKFFDPRAWADLVRSGMEARGENVTPETVALAAYATWHGEGPLIADATAPEFAEGGVIGKVLGMVPEPVGRGVDGFARVVDSLAEDGTSALLADGGGDTKRMFMVVQFEGSPYLVDAWEGRVAALTPDEVRDFGGKSTNLRASVFDTAGDPAPLAAFGWSGIDGGREVAAISAAFWARFAWPSPQTRQPRISRMTPRAFDKLDDVDRWVRDGGHGTVAAVTTRSEDGWEAAFVVVNFEKKLRILRPGPSGIQFLERLPHTFKDLVSVRAVVLTAVSEGFATADQAPVRNVVDVLADVDGDDEAFDFHWGRATSLPTVWSSRARGQAGLIDVALQVLFGGRDGYALVAAHSPYGRMRGRMFTVNPVGAFEYTSLPARVVLRVARNEQVVDWAGMRRVDAVTAFVAEGEAKVGSASEGSVMELDSPSDNDNGSVDSPIEEKRFERPLAQAREYGNSKFVQLSSDFESRLAEYLEKDYPGWPKVEREFRRLLRFVLAEPDVSSALTAPSGEADAEVMPDARTSLGANQVIQAIEEAGTIDSVIELLSQIITGTAWGIRWSGSLDLPPEAAGEIDSIISYRLLTLARNIRDSKHVELDLSLLRLGVFWAAREPGSTNYHAVMLGASYADPHRDTENADPALRYVDNVGRYRNLFPVDPEVLRENLEPFPDEYPVAALDMVLRAVDQQAKERGVLDAGRFRLLAERLGLDRSPSPEHDETEHRPYVPTYPPESRIGRMDVRPSPFLDMVEQRWAEVREAAGEPVWTVAGVVAKAKAANGFYGSREFDEAFKRFSSHEAWYAVPRRHALAVTKIVAVGLAVSSAADVEGLLTSIADGLAREAESAAVESARAGKKPEPGKEFEYPYFTPVPVRDEEQLARAEGLVTDEIRRLTVRGLPYDDALDHSSRRRRSAEMVAAAVRDGYDAGQAARVVVQETFLTPRREQRPEKPRLVYGSDPTDNVEAWWYGERTRSAGQRFRHYARRVSESPSIEGLFQVPGHPGLSSFRPAGVPDLPDEILFSHGVLTFLGFWHLFAVGAVGFDPRYLITDGWPAFLGDMPVIKALDRLSREKLPLGAWGFLIVVPVELSESDRAEPGSAHEYDKPYALGLIVDKVGLRPVRVRGSGRVAWPRYLSGAGHVFAIVMEPEALNPAETTDFLVGSLRPDGVEFAHHVLAAFFRSRTGRSGPVKLPVVIPENFASGTEGVEAILALANDDDAAGLIYLDAPSGESEVLIVLNDDGVARILNYRLGTVDPGALEYYDNVRAFVLDAALNALAGHQVPSDGVTLPSTAEISASPRPPLRIGEVLRELRMGEVLRKHTVVEALNHSVHPAATSGLRYVGEGIGALAEVFFGIRSEDRNALFVADFVDADRKRGIWYVRSADKEWDFVDAEFGDLTASRNSRNIGSVFAAVLPVAEYGSSFREWAGADWRGQFPRLSSDHGGNALVSLVEEYGRVGSLSIKAFTSGMSAEPGSGNLQDAYEALSSHPGIRYIAERNLVPEVLAIVAYGLSRDLDSSVAGFLDVVMAALLNEQESNHVPPSRAIRSLAEALEEYSEYLADFVPTDSVDPATLLATRDPEPFGLGPAGFAAVVDRVRGVRGASLVVITRSPDLVYEAGIVSDRGEVYRVDFSDGDPREVKAEPGTLGDGVAVFAVGLGPDVGFLAGVSRPSETPEADPQYWGTLRGGAAAPAELSDAASIDSAGKEDVASDDDDALADLPGLLETLAELSTWYGDPATPETVDAGATEGPVAQALSRPAEPAGHGFRGLARVRDSLPSGGSALMAVNAGEREARMAGIFSSGDHIDLVNGGRRTSLASDDLHFVGATLGEIHATVFDAELNPVPLIPLDDYQIAVYDKAEREYAIREKAATGGDILLSGTVGRVVSWFGRLYFIAKKAVFPESAADLSAILDREVVALVFGADAEDPIRWMVFPPLGHPLPVKPEDLPPEARAALAELGG